MIRYEKVILEIVEIFQTIGAEEGNEEARKKKEKCTVKCVKEAKRCVKVREKKATCKRKRVSVSEGKKEIDTVWR